MEDPDTAQCPRVAPLASMSIMMAMSPAAGPLAASSRTAATRPPPGRPVPAGGVKNQRGVPPTSSYVEVTAQKAETPAAQPARRLGRLFSSLASGLRSVKPFEKDSGYRAAPGALLGMRVFPSAVRARVRNGYSGRPGAAGARRAMVMWFRNDLRLHDNPALAAANAAGTSVLPVYIFDPRDYGKGAAGFDKTGPYRARFILDSVADLRKRLRDAGSDLIVRLGKPEDVLPQLVRDVQAGGVYCHAEVTYEESQVEAAVRAAAEKEGSETKALWGGTLYHPEDLPFKLEAMPTTYADFRTRVSAVGVRPTTESGQQLKALPLGRVDAGSIPSLQQLGLSAPPAAAAGAKQQLSRRAPQLGAGDLRGGEGEALRHLQAFLDELKASAARPGQQPSSNSTPALSSHFSCRVSPWLAAGCLSPRYMYQQLQQQLGGAVAKLGPGSAAATATATAAAASSSSAAGDARGNGGTSTDNANWLVFELLWRDFFRFITKKYATSQVAGAAARPAPAMAMA